jgi:hypothetical protein
VLDDPCVFSPERLSGRCGIADLLGPCFISVGGLHTRIAIPA